MVKQGRKYYITYYKRGPLLSPWDVLGHNGHGDDTGLSRRVWGRTWQCSRAMGSPEMPQQMQKALKNML